MTPFERSDDGSLVIPGNRVVRGRLRPPSSKSLTQRALNLVLLSGCEAYLQQPLESEDTVLFLAGLRRLGWATKRHPDGWKLEPGPVPAAADLWCGDNGTMLRFLTATLAATPGEWRLDGSERLRQRPVGPLIEALTALGARIRCLGQTGFAPLIVQGSELAGGSVEMNASQSSQFVSALLMAGARAAGPIEIQLEATVSKPYIELTRDAMSTFGGVIEGSVDHGFLRTRPAALEAAWMGIEADFSAACYAAAAAVVTGGEVVIEGLRARSAQGDRRFLEILQEIGARIEWSDQAIKVGAGEALRGLSVDMSDIPDQVPTLAAVAPFARGRTVICGVAHLRLKESNRLQAMASELRRLGASVDELEDGLEIEGSWSDCEPPTDPVLVQVHNDHRIAMSLAICGLRRTGVRIDRPDVVGKSYPDFWEQLGPLLES